MESRVFAITILAVLVSCGCIRDDYKSSFPTENRSSRNISINSVHLDTIHFEKVQFSFDGFLQIYSDYLSVIDKRFGMVYSFDTDGKLVEKHLGQGRGPGEIDAGYIEGHEVLKNGNHVFVGSSWDVHILDKDWHYIERFTMDWHAPTPDIFQVPDPDPREPILYTLDYGNFDINSDAGNNIYIQIYSEHPNFNGMVSRAYYEEGRILAKIDLQNGNVAGVFGRRSPAYLNFNFLPQHASFCFDIDNDGKFYITHEIDSLIYVYNNTFKPLYSFGEAGTMMNTDYTELSEYNVKEFRKLYFNDRPTKGYYRYIKVFDDQNLVFRSYTKGGQSLTDGLQIYRSGELIGDVDVPKGFKIAGYIHPYFYSDMVINETLDDFVVYRFRLEEESSVIVPSKIARMIFQTDVIDVGKISEDTTITAKYSFRNNGDTDLVIEYVKPDCICTSYKLSSDTVAAGGEGYLELVFNSKGKVAQQTIYTVIRSNSADKFNRLLLKADIQ